MEAVEDARRNPALFESFVIANDNWQAWRIFEQVKTQWRMGATGPIALDYNVVGLVIEYFGVPARKRKRRLREVTLIERGALAGLKGIRHERLWPEHSKQAY